MFLNDFLMDHHSLRTCSRYAIFGEYLLIISKKTVSKGILPQCCIKIFKVVAQSMTFLFFFVNQLLAFCDLQWPPMNYLAKLTYLM